MIRMLAFLWFACSVWATDVTQVLEFDFSNKLSIVDNGNYQLIEIKGANQTRQVGMPIVPVKFVKIALPPNHELLEINIKNDFKERIKLSVSNLKIFSGSHPYSLMSQKSYVLKNLSFQDWDNGGEPYPKSLKYQVQILHSVPVLMLWISPVQIDSFHHIFFTPKFSIEVISKMARADRLSQLTTSQYEEIVSTVENGNFIVDYLAPQKTASEIDYLIVAGDQFLGSQGENDLGAFVQFLEQRRGLKAQIHAMSEVPAGGVDRAQDLRDFIKLKYRQAPFRYLLLVGDGDRGQEIIPVRKLYSKINTYNGYVWSEAAEEIPSDFYYGCLDGDFDGNGNGIWGEPTDGIDGGDVDFLCELIVGRWPVSTLEELERVVSKTIRSFDIEYSKKTMLFGEELFASEGWWGGTYLDQLIGVVDDHGYVTRGFDSSWSMVKYYDQDSYWEGSDAIEAIKENAPMIVNHLGHSQYYINMRIYSWGYYSFGNEIPFFYYTQGCIAGDFTRNDSIVELFFLDATGAIATISNSRYGLGPEDPDPSETDTPGASQILNRHFIDQLLNDSSGAYHFAKAHQNSKRDLLVYIDHQEARWVTWTANYFGDPSLVFNP